MMQRTTICVDGKIIDLSAGVVMAIVNITPDSFFSGSRVQSEQDFKAKVEQALTAGAQIIDLGGYSSRPGATDVSAQEELERLLWAMELLRGEHPEAVVSLDTFRSAVAAGVMERFGRCIINDISAGELDSKMFETAARWDVPYIAMHMRGTPQNMTSQADYVDVVDDLLRYFVPKLEQLTRLGVKDIIVDPGFGFSKTVAQNFELLRRMSELQVLARPLLAGVSRKSMIWRTLGITPEEALTGTTALHWESLRQGALILRAHDVKEAVQTIELFRAFKEV